MNRRTLTKLLILAFAAIIALSAGVAFRRQRTGYDKIVLSPSVTSIGYLSDYEKSLEGSKADVPVFFCDSGREGATVLVAGGAHTSEVGGILSCYLLLENLNITEGRMIVIPVVNLSAQSGTLSGFGYPERYYIDTEWGQTSFRVGSRATSPLDQWPDPMLYAQYPSGQHLATEEARNLNRAYPGREGSLTERIAKAVMNLMKKEDVDLAFDLHEASITYPVNDTIIASEEGFDIACLASMMMNERGERMEAEIAAPSLKGYSHSEWGRSGTLSFLIEVPTPLIDRTPGAMLPSLPVTGYDPFLKRIADCGFAGVPYDEDGYPISERVALHLSAIREVIDIWSVQYSDLSFSASWPLYDEILENGVGRFISNPEESERAFEIRPR